MNIYLNKHLFSIALVALVTGSSLLTSTALAANPDDPYFFTCRPDIKSDVKKATKPKINIVLDKSGSMQFHNKWKTAVTAITKIMEENQKHPRAYFGLSLYSSHVTQPIKCLSGTEEAIIYELISPNTRPTGGTNTSGAIQASFESTCHTQLSENQIGVTMVITDGAPNNSSRTLATVCDKAKKGNIFFIGLGKGTDTLFNNLAAAAGGTGHCNNGDPCSDANLNMLMQNANSRSESYRTFAESCSGSFSAQETSDLVHAIDSITAKVGCNYPMQTDANGVVKEDPSGEYAYLKLQPQGFAEPIPYAGSTKGKKIGAENSYTFANSSRTLVTLGTEVCKLIGKNSSNTTYIISNNGCRCEQEEGTACTLDGSQNSNLCPIGKWQCNQKNHTDECVPATDLTTNLPCSVPGKLGICKNSVYSCDSSGNLQCLQTIEPMPEICDGIDNDCDGIDDNTATSWPKFKTATDKLKNTSRDEYNALHALSCFAKPLCSCPENTGILELTPDAPLTTSPSDLIRYKNSWTTNHGSCQCQAQ